MVIAVTGQAETHAGSSQCMHWRLAITYRIPPGAFASATSLKLTTVKVLALSVVGFCSPAFTPSSFVWTAFRSFHCLQETWQERQPTHRVVSTSVALHFDRFGLALVVVMIRPPS